jgi:hypothetical protein
LLTKQKNLTKQEISSLLFLFESSFYLKDLFSFFTFTTFIFQLLFNHKI